MTIIPLGHDAVVTVNIAGGVMDADELREKVEKALEKRGEMVF